MDEFEQRLKTASEECVKNYAAWRQKEQDGQSRETLQVSIHELRKAVSRLEIEIAVSERGDMAGRPIPIPAHRSSRPKSNPDDGDGYGDDAQPDFGGNDAGPGGAFGGGQGNGNHGNGGHGGGHSGRRNNHRGGRGGGRPMRSGGQDNS